MTKADWRPGTPMFEASQWDPSEHPELFSVSCGLVRVRIVPVLKASLPVEFVQIPVDDSLWDDKLSIAAQAFNMTWQSGGAWGNWRGNLLRLEEPTDWPDRIRTVFERCDEKVAVRFIPTGESPSLALAQHIPLYQLLPLRLLQKHHLPPLGRRCWPITFFGDHDLELSSTTRTLRIRLARAFAEHLWPLLVPQSGLGAFSDTDPIRLLAFNLDFWLPYLDRIIEERMRFFGKRPFPNAADRRAAARARRQLGPDFNVEAPLFNAHAWRGEDEAWEVTREMVEAADNAGKLRSIIDAVRSHRVEDDFSDKWSYAREDFERRLYSKRSKYRVSFVELNDTLPVHGPDKEVDGNLLWDDLIAMIQPKDRRVVICLRSGTTQVSEIASVLGYANHSAVSKKLARIRAQVRKLIS